MFYLRYLPAWISLWFQPLRPLGVYLSDIEKSAYRGTLRAIDERGLSAGQHIAPAQPTPSPAPLPKPKSVTTKSVTKRSNKKGELNGLKCKVCRKGLRGRQTDYCCPAHKMKYTRKVKAKGRG